MVKQSKGKKHILYIRREAMKLWKLTNFQKGLRDDCLKETLERHRLKVESEIKKSREKIIDQQKHYQQELSLSSFDMNGWAG